MNINYLAFFLISFVPVLIALVYYNANSPIVKWASSETEKFVLKLSPLQFIWALFLSVLFVYGFMNLVIHQLGFYELFFTDIMKGSTEAQQIVDEFLAQYGDKHRHFGHGVLHGVMYAFILPLPFIGFYAMLENKNYKFVIVHLLYWLITCALTCGLIAEFV